MKAYNKSKRIKSNNHLDRYKVCIITYKNCEQWYIPLKHVIMYSTSEGHIISLAIDLTKVSTRTGFTNMYEDKNAEYRRVVKGEDITCIEFATMRYNYKGKKVDNTYYTKYLEDSPWNFSSDNLLQKNELCYFETNYSCRLKIKWDTSEDINSIYTSHCEGYLEITREKYEQYKDRIHNWNIEII